LNKIKQQSNKQSQSHFVTLFSHVRYDTIRYDTIRKNSLTWITKLTSDQLNLAHVVRKKIKHTTSCTSSSYPSATSYSILLLLLWLTLYTRYNSSRPTFSLLEATFHFVALWNRGQHAGLTKQSSSACWWH